MVVFVISKNGERLMPTIRYGRVRHLLKEGKAIIYSRKPFAIQLTYDVTPHNQPIEVCVDTGYQHIGISVKSESREYVSAQYNLLTNEKSSMTPKERTGGTGEVESVTAKPDSTTGGLPRSRAGLPLPSQTRRTGMLISSSGSRLLLLLQT